MLWRHASLAHVIALALSPCAFVHAEPFAYITNQGSHNVSVIDLASQKVVATVPVGRSPAGVAASSRAGRLYVSNPDSKTISVIDVRATARASDQPSRDHRPSIASIKVGKAPYGAALAADGKLLYVTNQHDDTVSVLDARSGRALGSIATGRNSRGFGAFIGAPEAP